MSISQSNTETKLVKEITDKIKFSGLKIFPDDFLNSTNYTEEIIPDKILFIASELFGQCEIKTSDGEFFKMVDDINLAKYYVYSSLQRKSILKIPSESSALIKMIVEYEKYFDNLVKVIQDEIKSSGLNVNFMKITNDIIHSLNLTRF
jgi:hypothetical protein